MENKKLGINTGLLAYVFWGMLGVFWETLHAVPAMDTLAYRIVWSLVTIGIILTIQHDWHTVFSTIKQLARNRKLGWIILSSLLISVNWLIYIYMVTHHQATEASLGYYIMPLINVAVAILFLHEQLSKTKVIAIILVIIGVVVLTIQSGSLPLNTLLMAASFCFYGLIKKQVQLPATISLTLETLFVMPIAVIYLLWSPHTMLQNGPRIAILLVLSGIITVVPLLLFAVATKNTDFITLSFIQYLNPTIQLLMAIVFIFIWAGIAVFVYGSFRSYRQFQQMRKKPIKKETVKQSFKGVSSVEHGR